MATAILVDGGFFVRRFRHVYPDIDPADASAVAQTLRRMCAGHLTSRSNATRRELYRIFFYDCPPVTKKAHRPISRKAIDFSRTGTALFRHQLHDEVRRLRKTALRLGHLSEDSGWVLRPDRLKALLRGQVAVAELSDEDFVYDVKQKGVDMRIGVDIASLAFKRQVDQIVLIAGDADFVPAAKLARREGIDFVLDPMWHPIHASLNEHIDGLRSTCPNPNRPKGEPLSPDDADADLT
jgi:uncharacterized LabA/DUF88 family protein